MLICIVMLTHRERCLYSFYSLMHSFLIFSCATCFCSLSVHFIFFLRCYSVYLSTLRLSLFLVFFVYLHLCSQCTIYMNSLLATIYSRGNKLWLVFSNRELLLFPFVFSISFLLFNVSDLCCAPSLCPYPLGYIV